MRRIVFLFLLVTFTGELTAQIGGTTIFNVVNIPGSARVASLGGSFFAVKDGDLQLAAFNPSIIDSTMDTKISMSYVNYFDNINLGYASYGKMWNSKLSSAATLQYIHYGEQQELDALGYELGSFQASDYALTLGAGYQYDSLWTLGANFKTIYSSLANYTSLGFAVDGAVTYHKKRKNFTASLIAKNLGMQVITYNDGDRRKLPFEFQVGFTKRPAHAPFRFSVVFENLQQWDLSYVNPNAVVITDPVTGEVLADNTWKLGDRFMRHIVVGTEFLLSESLNIRLGYNYRRRQELKVEDKPGMAGFSYGFGFRVSRFNFSYGRAIFHLAGPSNHFSVTTSLNAW
ncbi:MAG: type IX secretion system protein PorQ [Flavobacteriales bacterium]